MTAADRLSSIGVRRLPLAITAAVVCVLVTFPLAAYLNIWQDEAYTLQTTSRDVAYAVHQSLAFEQNAPLYFVLIVLLRHITSSVLFLRCFSIACAAVTIALVPALTRRYLPSVNPAITTFATAWNPFLIWAAVEMRVYALVVLLSALLLLSFYDAFLARRRSIGAVIFYAACAVVALYTQYYLAFLIAAQGFALLAYRRDALVSFLIVDAAVAIAFSPMVFVVPGQVQNFDGGFAAPASPFHSLAFLCRILLRFVLPILLQHATAIYLALAAIGAVAAILGRRAFRRSGDGMLPFITICAVFLFALGAYAARVHILTRHAAFMYVPAILSVFGLLTFLRPKLARRASYAWFVIALALSTLAVAQTYAPLAKPGDWQRATAYLQSHERSREPIVIFEAENALPFAYYYHGPNRVVAIPEAVNFQRYDVTRFVVHNEVELRARVPRSREIWLITAGECTSANIAFGCPVVDRFFASRYKTLSDRHFYGSRVRLLRLAE